jgi:hypothetical protein
VENKISDMKEKVKLWKYSGILLVATGILHSIVAILFGKDDLWAIFQDGLLDAVGEDVPREFAFWFLICGIFVVFLGQILHYYIKKEQRPAPLFLGYNILVLSVIGCVIVPVSGFWLFIPQALIIIFAKRNDKK